MKRDQGAAWRYAWATVLLWATVAAAFKIALAGLGVVTLLAVAAPISTAVFLVMLAARGELGLLRRSTAGEWGRSALAGLLNPFLYYLVLFEAYRRLPAQMAQPLNWTWPLVLTLMSVPCLGHRFTRRDLEGLLVSFSGVALISFVGGRGLAGGQDRLGIALALGSSVIWASSWMLTLRDRRDPAVRLAGAFLFGSLYAIALATWAGGPDLQALSPRTVAAAAWVGLFEMGLTFFTWTRALELSGSAARVANLVYLSPFLSLFVIRLATGERILPTTFAGLGLVVLGIVRQGRSAEPDSAAIAGGRPGG